MHGPAVEIAHPGVLEDPRALAELRRARIDTAAKRVAGAEEQDHHIFKPRALFGDEQWHARRIARSRRPVAATGRCATRRAGTPDRGRISPRSAVNSTRSVDENGVSTMTVNTPSVTATASGGARKFHAETPAARIASSSWLRDSLTKANTPPSSTANGSSFRPRLGNCRRPCRSRRRSAPACSPCGRRDRRHRWRTTETESRQYTMPTPVRNCTREIAIERPGPAHAAASCGGARTAEQRRQREARRCRPRRWPRPEAASGRSRVQ